MTIERAAQDIRSVSIDILSDFPGCYSQYHDTCTYRIEEEEEEEEEVGESTAGIIVIVL